MTTENQNICKNCGYRKDSHPIVRFDNKKFKTYTACNKFTPQTQSQEDSELFAKNKVSPDKKPEGTKKEVGASPTTSGFPAPRGIQ